MSTLIYYVAVSVDGFIAPQDGSLDWLAAYNTGIEDYGYGEFYQSIDALIEGRKTYEQALGFGAWPHPGKPCWVCSRSALISTIPEVQITTLAPADLLRQIAAHGHQRIWLVGGGQLAAAFRAVDLIDEYVLTIIPIMLGTGRPLFCAEANRAGTNDAGSTAPLKLISCKTFRGGVAQLYYRRCDY